MKLLVRAIFFIFLVNLCSGGRWAGTPGARLLANLIPEETDGFRQHILPVKNTTDGVDIRLLLKLVQLTDIDEPQQIMTTFVWISHEWRDEGLTWNPEDYGNLVELQMPAKEIWLPDTVLYNNADGDYQITQDVKVNVKHDGRVAWEPPAIYKSFCDLDVKYFPFDEQICELKFGPWSYDIAKVDYWLYDVTDHSGRITNYLDYAADMTEYSNSSEWEVLQIVAKREVYSFDCCPEEYVYVQYEIHIRRKILFYFVNLIIPCVTISFLTVFVFYLPAESCEKITLSISILVSLTVFILFLYEIIPPTSKALPLMCAYLLFTMVLVTLSTIISIFILNIHFRHPHVLDMPKWFRYVFLDFLPKLIFYKSPLEEWYSEQEKLIQDVLRPASLDGSSQDMYEVAGENNRNGEYTRNRKQSQASQIRLTQRPHRNLDSSYYENVMFMAQSFSENGELTGTLKHPEVRQAFKDVQYIANKYRESVEELKQQSDWEAVGRVLDRLFFIIFAASVFIGSCVILASAPSLYDTKQAIG